LLSRLHVFLIVSTRNSDEIPRKFPSQFSMPTSNIGMGDESGKAFAVALKENATLKELNLGRNKMGKDVMVMIQSAAREGCRVEFS
jgi:hypothetical protein